MTGYDMNWVASLMVKFDVLGINLLDKLMKIQEITNES